MNRSVNPTLIKSKLGIWGPSFQGLLWTQWLTAVNDNVFRWFVIGVGKDQFSAENQTLLLVLGSSCFILPYVLFASLAGWLADRYMKRKVIIACKFAEIAIMSLGVIAVALMDDSNPNVYGVDVFFFLLLAAVFLMGTQSALFAPAKLGTIPELLDEKTIAAGNGVFNLATLSATVIGMALGGWLSDVTDRGSREIWIAASALIGIAVVGTFLSFLVRTLPAANRKARFPYTLIGESIRDIRLLYQHRFLFRIGLGIVFFWAIAAFAQLNIDALTEESGGLSESDRTPLLIAVTLGIGIGSVLAGKLSSGRIELGLVPMGAVGIAAFSFWLWFAPEGFIDGNILSVGNITVCSLLCALGLSAGIFDVPLAAYLQHNSPIEKRGALLAATNCLAFSGILLMFVVLLVCRLPAKDGSLENLPNSMVSAELTESQSANIQAMLDRYDTGQIAAERLNLRGYVDSVEPQLRKVAITELVFRDSKRRQENETTLTQEEYRAEFRDSAAGDASDEQLRILKATDDEQGRMIKATLVQSMKLPAFDSRQMFMVMGVLTIPVIFYSLYRLNRQFVRLVFYGLFHLLYRVRVNGLYNIPREGGAIVVSNHNSWLDGAILIVMMPRIPRMIAWAGNFDHWLLKRWAAFCGIILISGGPKSIRKGLQDAKDSVRQGEIVGLFPEGGISPENQIKTLKPGLSRIMDPKHPAPIIPVYIDEVWGSIFSYAGGKAFGRLPSSFRHPISVHIGEPIENTESMFAIRQSLQELSTTTMEQQAGKFVSAPAAFIKSCKQAKFRSKIGDSMGEDETGGKLLTRALVAKRLLRNHVLDDDEVNVAVLIPPTVGGAIINLALALDKRVAVNLNYSLSNELMDHCIKDAEIKTVLTTRKVAEKFDFEFDCKVFYLDDLKSKVTAMDKAAGVFQSYLVPTGVLMKMHGLDQIQPDDLLTIVFTSGSTGVPKGVMLTQQNIMSNVDGIEKVASLRPSDTIIGILPFFHSMGYTVTLWTPMTTCIRGVYHFNPLDAKIIGKITEKFKGTIIVATPTFLRSYMRRCTPEQFKSLDMVIAGAERLPPELCEEFEKKFGVRPVEGYGTTELSPVAAVNIPYSRQSGKDFQVDAKEGTVGRPMPRAAAKTTDLDSGKELGPNESGMLWIKGPSVMKGYLNRPEETAKVMEDHWYKTGDVAIIDDDGFIKITGRMSRFSKIGGEMVPHLKIEEVLTEFLDSTPDDDSDDHLLVAVTAVPDEKKGERLVVLYTNVSKTVDEMLQALKDAGLPNMFIPSADSCFQVEQLPLLGTGKLDLRGIKDLALEKCNLN